MLSQKQMANFERLLSIFFDAFKVTKVHGEKGIKMAAIFLASFP